jgi:hypothetical protein
MSLDSLHNRIETQRVGDHTAGAAGREPLSHTVCFCHAGGERFLDEKRLSGLTGSFDDRVVKSGRNHNCDRVNRGIGKKAVVIGVIHTAVGGGELLPFLPIPPAHCREGCLWKILDNMLGVPTAMLPYTNEANP